MDLHAMDSSFNELLLIQCGWDDEHNYSQANNKQQSLWFSDENVTQNEEQIHLVV